MGDSKRFLHPSVGDADGLLMVSGWLSANHELGAEDVLSRREVGVVIAPRGVRQRSEQGS
jgi:hypothetical protein